MRPAIGGLAAFWLLIAGSYAKPTLAHDAKVQADRSLPAQTGDRTNAGAQGRSEKFARRLAELYDQQNCQAFFAAFPDTFAEFDQLYGFAEQQGERPLYAKYYSHVTYLFDCTGVSDRAKLKRAISLGRHGRWKADAAALVQEAAFKLISRYPSETQEILAKLPDNPAASFWYFGSLGIGGPGRSDLWFCGNPFPISWWFPREFPKSRYFLFDGPHPADEGIGRQVKPLLKRLGPHSKQAKLLRDQYKKLLAIKAH